MNLSGGPVRKALERYKMSPAELLVICDDVNLPLGQLRLRMSGSAGGHNGLVSLIDELETDSFARLRIGVGGGDPGADLTEYVLRKLPPEVQEKTEQVMQRAADAAQCYFREGAQRAMNQYNRDEETATLSPEK
jgi:PTH1 family peptidyl-tRNA hydrolase